MKNLLSFLLVISIGLISCKKETAKCNFSESTATATANEIAVIQNYLNTNSITATQHASGVFYSIGNPGSGSSPSVCSYIGVEYTGSVINGNVFDATQANSPAFFTLGQLILGWQRVLPVLKETGTITLYIPPSLGYGNRDVRDNNNVIIIPANSYLKFEIKLVDVQ